MKSLKRILIFRYSLIIAAVLIAVSLLVIIPIRSYTIGTEKDNLAEQAELFARDFQRFFTGKMTPHEIDDEMEILAEHLPVRLTLMDTRGTVLGDSDFPAEEMEDHAGRPEVAAALAGRVDSARRESRTLGKAFIYAAAPVTVDGEVVGVARVALEEEDVTPVVLQVVTAVTAGSTAVGTTVKLIVRDAKFTPEGGRISISAEQDDQGDLRLKVADTGIGINPDEQQLVADVDVGAQERPPLVPDDG